MHRDLIRIGIARGTVIQYNYSHDNYGGLVLVCNDGTADASFNVGNLGTIVRYNVSIGDGVRPEPTRAGCSHRLFIWQVL